MIYLCLYIIYIILFVIKISIITTNYNTDKYLEQTIRSILSQKGDFDLEYIIIDGGSKDNSLKIIKKVRRGKPGHPGQVAPQAAVLLFQQPQTLDALHHLRRRVLPGADQRRAQDTDHKPHPHRLCPRPRGFGVRHFSEDSPARRRVFHCQRPADRPRRGLDAR